ncbi:hypothetical protein E2C01_050533 [Portunus trituberculatus]|uniref:Uncharacterized protein n=1 Tax=Portunus trituberculatus TaxID=210409 RepID=A0A5B7G990_PORTR|nr:hypothetical protein [Portunus trituberculatus]
MLAELPRCGWESAISHPTPNPQPTPTLTLTPTLHNIPITCGKLLLATHIYSLKKPQITRNMSAVLPSFPSALHCYPFPRTAKCPPRSLQLALFRLKEIPMTAKFSFPSLLGCGGQASALYPLQMFMPRFIVSCKRVRVNKCAACCCENALKRCDLEL